MADIKDQLIKDSYNYVLQSDLSTGVVYRIGGSIPVNPIFSSGLTINGDFNYSNGTEQPGYVLTTNGSGYSYWNAVSGSSGISGSGTSNYLPKWSGSTSLVNSLVYDSSTGVTIGTGFTWDNTNSRLGIGTTTPTYKFEVRDTGSSSVTHFLKFRNDNNDYGGITIGSGSGQDLTIQQNTGYGYLATSGFRIGSANGIIWTNNGSIFRIVDPATEATNYLRIASTTGNVLINTGTDSGFKLDVNGTARIQGNTNIINSSGPSLLTLGGFNNLPELRFINTNTKITVDANSAINFVSSWGVVTNHYLFYPASNLSNTSTTGVANGVALNIGFAPTSGTASFNQLSLVQTINQTGGASGITRGVYVNPTLTSAADFRAIETTTGNVIFGGTGSVGVGTDTSLFFKLVVQGGLQVRSSASNFVGLLIGDQSIRRRDTGTFSLGTNDSATAIYMFAPTNNVGIGTATDAGYKLDVNGGAIIRQGLQVNNPLTVNTIYPIQNQNLEISAAWADSTQVTISTITNKAQVLIVKPISNLTLTSGTHDTQRITHTFQPTGGTASINGLTLNQTINQLSGASGTTRGIYVNPTISAATDFRAIETTSGNVLFGTGFTWDNTNSRLNVGTNLGAYGVTWIQSDVASTTDYTLVLNNRNTLGVGGESTGLYFANSGYGAASQPYNIGHIVGSIKTLATNFNNVTTRGVMTFNLNNSSSVQEEVMRLVNTTKNVLIGTTTDAGYKLDVNGTSAFRGTLNVFAEQEIRQDGVTQTFTSNLGIFRFKSWSNSTLTAYLNGWNYEGYLNFALNIGTSSTAVASAVLELTSTTRGFLPPRMTTSQKNAITSPATGLTVYDNTINETQTYNGSAWITKRNGVEVYQAPLFINTYAAAAGNGNTLLYGSPYPLTTSTNGNIIKINAIFQAKQTAVNTFIRIYASSSPTSITGAIQLGNFTLTAANAAAGLDTIGYDKTFILNNQTGSYQIISVDAFGTNNDVSPQALGIASIGSGVISYPYICVTLNQSAVLHSITINYSR